MNKPIASLRSADDLVTAGLTTAADRDQIAAVGARYAIAVTPVMTALMDRSAASDPIARQFVPSSEELITTGDELADPIGDSAHAAVPGLVHRYRDRVLLKLANVCPVYCRFCFRRETVGRGDNAALTDEQIEAALAYIRARPEIFEVIVTGGDPLILSPRRLRGVTEALSEIGHVAVIRWHTRVPVVAPERITPELIAALTSTHKAVYVALHCNHARELTSTAKRAIGVLVERGIVMVSQTVLLKGINDDAETLEELLRSLLAARVKPYYLHHGDLAPGTGHFRTTIEEGQALMRALRGRLSGLALPLYVLDIPGGAGKVPATADYIGPIDTDTSTRIITDPEGTKHVYRDACGDPTLR